MVRTDPNAASSASAAADGVGDKHGGSGASGVDESCSAEAIASATLVSMDPPVKQLTRAEEVSRRGSVQCDGDDEAHWGRREVEHPQPIARIQR